MREQFKKHNNSLNKTIMLINLATMDRMSWGYWNSKE